MRLLRSIGLAAALNALALATWAQEAAIQVKASHILHSVSPYLAGTCLEDVNHEVYGGIYSQMIFGESFQEPAPSVAPAGFTAYGGNWQPQQGELAASAGAGPKLVFEAINLSTGEAGVDVRFSSDAGGNAGLIVQVSQPGVGADLFTGYEVSLAPAGYLVLGRHRQNWESISQVACAVPTNQWVTLRVALAGATLQIFVNGVRVLQYTDTQHPLVSGQAGLRTWQQDARFRNFSITTNGVAQSIAFQPNTNSWSEGVSGMWSAFRGGTAGGSFALETTTPFVGSRSQRLSFTNGAGQLGIQNQGLNRWGMFFAGGQPYEGCLWARAETPVTLFATLESGDGTTVYAEQSLAVVSNSWQRLAFSLTPAAANSGGRFAIKLKQSGSVVIGYALLQPGGWGRFADLPVRKDVGQGLVGQGNTVIRYGGSMVNADGYRWKNMVGPRELRPPYQGHWYPYSTDGWGILEFLNYCEAAGFLGVPDLSAGETPQDMADFIQYVNGSTNSPWGARRAADGHPRPYGLKYVEVGNEERVDDTYYQKFQPLAAAIWAQDPNLIIIVGDFGYAQNIADPFSFGGASSGITTLAAHQKILQLAKQNNREVWFDVHVGTEGPTPDSSLPGLFSYITALGQIAGGARYKVVVFELNAGNHSQGRALANALALNAIARDGRLPITTSANCLQPDGENDNAWDQGLLFLNPSQVWLQPPGYVTRMVSSHFQPELVLSTVQRATGNLDVCATRSDDGQTLVLQVVNLSDAAAPAAIQLDSFTPTNPVAGVEVLAGALSAVNTAAQQQNIVPVQSSWRHGYTNGVVHCTFAPNSFTAITFRGAATPAPPAVLKHRWSFNEPAGATAFVDSVPGVANGALHGAASLDGKGNLVLPGLNQNNNYAELPPGLLPGDYSAATFEFWASLPTPVTVAAWQRSMSSACITAP